MADNTERMHSDASGLIGPKSGDDEVPFLNTLDEVGNIVRTFAAEVLKRFASGDAAGFMSWLEGECRDWNAVFIGKGRADRPYITDPAWNNPDRLGHKALLIMGIDGEHRNAVRDVFMVLADQLTDVAAEAESSDLDGQEWKLDGPIERATHALLGLPYDPS